MINKYDIAGFINNVDLDKKKVEKLSIKAESKAEQDKILKLQAFQLCYIRGKSHFEKMVIKSI